MSESEKEKVDHGWVDFDFLHQQHKACVQDLIKKIYSRKKGSGGKAADAKPAPDLKAEWVYSTTALHEPQCFH